MGLINQTESFFLTRCIMRGTERVNGELKHFYQYKATGPKFYYKPQNSGGLRIPFKRPFIPNRPYEERSDTFEYCEYVPQPQLSKLEQQFRLMHPNIQKLINQWLLIFGFQTINDISADEVNKTFRQLSLKHHPDRGGRRKSSRNSRTFEIISRHCAHWPTQ